MKTVTIDEAINQAGFGAFQTKLMVICGLGWAADAMEILLISSVLPAVGREWQLGSEQLGLLGTVVFLGMLAGAWFWGRVSDLWGRKPGFISTVAITSIFGLASAFSPSFTVLMLLRALTGFGVGGNLPVDYSIFAEYLPANKRGRYLVLLESFWAMGAIVAAGLGWLVVPTLGWRWLLGLAAIPGVIIYFIRRHVPESPRYLMVNGQVEAAAEVVRHVAAQNGVNLGEFVLEAGSPVVKTKLNDLVKPALARTSLLLWTIWFSISLGYYGIFTWLPKFFDNAFKQQGLVSMPAYQSTFILVLAQLPGYFSAAYLVERWGRRKTLGIYLIISGVFTFLFALVSSPGWMLGVGSIMSFFTLGAWGAIYAYTPEAYPTNLRSTGVGTASGMARIAGVIAPTMVGVLMGNGQGNLILPLTIFAVFYLIGGVASFLLPFEPNQKALQDTL